MYLMHKADVQQREYDGLRSHFLLDPDSGVKSNLVVTWVDVPPGASQMKHSHPPEQVYVVIAGKGRMHVGVESREIVVGELAHVPPDTEHHIVNTGEEMLTYLSAATPAFDVASYYEKEST